MVTMLRTKVCNIIKNVIPTIENEIEALDCRLKTCSNQIKARLGEDEKQIVANEQAIEKLKLKISKFSTVLDELKSSIDLMNSAIEKLDSEKADLQLVLKNDKKLSDKIQKLDEIKASKEELEAKIQELSDKIKKAGYATAPSYPASLIKIIEDYRLYRFDSDSIALPSPSLAQQQSNEKITPDDRSPLYRISLSRQLFSRNGVLYVLAESYDSYESLAMEFNLFKREILRFNDLRRSEPLSSGQVVYLQRKKADAAEHLEMHVVESGETMRDIAQRYAVRAKELYRYNNLPPGSDPPPGEVIFLCKPDKVK